MSKENKCTCHVWDNMPPIPNSCPEQINTIQSVKLYNNSKVAVDNNGRLVVGNEAVGNVAVYGFNSDGDLEQLF